MEHGKAKRGLNLARLSRKAADDHTSRRINTQAAGRAHTVSSFFYIMCNVRNCTHLVTATRPPRLAMATEEARAGAEDGLGDNAVDAPDDLASLASLDNASVMSGVQRRFEQDKIYTRINTLSLC